MSIAIVFGILILGWAFMGITILRKDVGLDSRYDKAFFEKWKAEWKNDPRFKDFVK